MGDVRGRIMRPEKRLQLLTYENVRYGKITPTDIDGVIDFGGYGFVFYEIKHAGTPIKQGQELCLENLVRAIESGGKEAVAMFAVHTVDDVSKVIDAADCIVKRVFFHGCWHDMAKPATLKEKTDSFKRYIDERRNLVS